VKPALLTSHWFCSFL